MLFLSRVLLHYCLETDNSMAVLLRRSVALVILNEKLEQQYYRDERKEK